MSTLNGQVIGQAHFATRALLDRAVAPLGVDFGQVLALNALTAGPVARTPLVRRLANARKVDESAVHEVIDHLVDAGLAQLDDTTEAQVSLTDAGHATQARVAEAVAGITARLYGDIPPAEADVAGRVLTLVTERANDELAGEAAQK
ncbi:MarR family winged helix-turn-helix transcriptional regulator [Micromonospora sp. CA-249363]|uniref:MarR family winged helix-turn-helix transcriptional regulator n=1 Tax=Micromonospora sp. CA-249363 TaxID=3239963 RepID=UPI003D94B1ED